MECGTGTAGRKDGVRPALPCLNGGRDSRVLTIVLPLPAKELSPNARCHWGAKASKVKRARRDAGIAAQAVLREAKFAKLDRATIEPVFFVKTKRRRDGDNALASLKAYVDGIVDAGVVKDDSHLTFLPVRFEQVGSDPRLELIVRAA